MPPQPLKFKTRYKRGGDDGDEDNDEILLMLANKSPPSLCMVFALPDEEETLQEDLEETKEDREKIIARLRTMGFDIDEMVNQQQNKVFVRLRLPKRKLYEQAIKRRVKVTLDKGAPGAPVFFNEELIKLQVFRPPEDENGDEVFSGLQQLEMADFLLRSEPFRDGTDEVEQLIPEKMLTEELDTDPPVTRIIGYYYLHEPFFRLKLLAKWAGMWTAPQPLNLVRVYLGEKIALFFTWLGYYISMLWLPAVGGLIMMTQVRGGTHAVESILLMSPDTRLHTTPDTARRTNGASQLYESFL